MGQQDSSGGAYRLWRQAGGRGAFAEVQVEVVKTGDQGPPEVAWSVDPSDSTSAQPDLDPENVAAAFAGVSEVLDALAAMGVETQGRVVYLTHVGINLVDTEPTAVRAAAGAATAASFNKMESFEVVFDAGWQCRPKSIN